VVRTAKAKAEAETTAIKAMTVAEDARAKAKGAKVAFAEGVRDFTVDVFIRTKGGENIKCGLVSVLVFDEKTIAAWLPRITKVLANRAFDLESELVLTFNKKQKAERVAQDAKRAYEIAVQANHGAFKKWISEVRKVLPKATGDLTDENIEFWANHEDKDIKNAAPGAMKALNQTRDVALATQEASSKADFESTSAKDEWEFARHFSSWLTIVPDAVLNSLTEPVMAVKTDADGRCSGQLPKPGWYAFCAGFNRLVGETHESDTWLIWVNLEDPARQKIMLSNDNTLFSANPNNLLQIIPWPKERPNAQ